MIGYVGSSMAKNRDEDSGRFTETHTDEELLQFLRESGAVGTADVAEEFDYQQPTAYRRLQDLEERGEVESQKIGNARLWQAHDEE